MSMLGDGFLCPLSHFASPETHLLVDFYLLSWLRGKALRYTRSPKLLPALGGRSRRVKSSKPGRLRQTLTRAKQTKQNLLSHFLVGGS